MIRILYLVSIICLAGAAFFAFDSAAQWLDLGHGLHPYIALPFGTVCMIGAFYGCYRIVIHQPIDLGIADELRNMVE